MVEYQQVVGLLVIAYLVMALAIRSKRTSIPVWSIMTFSSFIVVIVGLIDIDELGKVIDLNVIFFLIGMFSIAGLMDSSGLLEAISYWFVGRFRRKTAVLIASAYLFGLLSAIAVNDTVALIGPTIALMISKAAGIDFKAMALLLMFSITVGSAMTPVGNPQNVLIAIGSGMPAPFANFVSVLTIPTLMALPIVALILKWLYKIRDGEIGIGVVPHESIKNKRDAVLGAAGLAITVAALVVNDLMELMGMPHIKERGFIPFVVAAGIYPLASSPRGLLSRVDWGTIVFFIAMYVTMAGVWRSGALAPLFDFLMPEGGGKALTIVGITVTSIVVSQLISNVPFAGLYLSYMKHAGFVESDIYAWLTLSSMSTLAGALTLLGAASNIIVLEAMEGRYGLTITFVEFLKVGCLITAVCVLIYLPFLYFV